jgi:hypothetical protein
MDVCVSYVVLWSYAGVGLATGQTLFQGNLPIDIKKRISGKN